MSKTKRQLEEDLRQAEQDLVQARRDVEVARITGAMVYAEMKRFRKENEALKGWYLALKKHMEKDVLPEGLD